MASIVVMRLVTQKPMVTAGLKWPPEMCPRAEIIRAMARPWAMAMARRVVPSGSWRKPKAQIAPAPKKMSAKVPMNSAESFWGVEYMEMPPGAAERPRGILAEEGKEKQRS